MTIAVCANCSAQDANCPSDCIPPELVYGAEKPAMGSFTNRELSVKLPDNYDLNTAYPVVYSAGACSDTPTAVPLGEQNAVQVGLGSGDDACYAYGGIDCVGLNGDDSLCIDNPELPYLRAAAAWVESNICVDRDREFLAGYDWGADEVITLAASAGDIVRGFVGAQGGLPSHRRATAGPVAALLVTDDDPRFPVGPVDPTSNVDDDVGLASARDLFLQLNGCAGTATAPYDASYPACVKYTGCPAAYPVVWCPLSGSIYDSYNGTTYVPGSVANDPLMWSFLSNLPAAP